VPNASGLVGFQTMMHMLSRSNSGLATVALFLVGLVVVALVAFAFLVLVPA
jgi:hypothetical protein